MDGYTCAVINGLQSQYTTSYKAKVSILHNKITTKKLHCEKSEIVIT